MKNTWQSATASAHLPPPIVDATSSAAPSKPEYLTELVPKVSTVSLAPPKPLNLLDLPVDILKEIVKEVRATFGNTFC